MKENTKKTIKTLLIFTIIIAVIALLLIYVVFPQPKPTEAYQYSNSIFYNANHKIIIDANEEMISIISGTQTAHDHNQKIKESLENSHSLYLTYNNLNEYSMNQLAFCENNGAYNTNCKKMKKLVPKIEDSIENTVSFINSHLIDFFEHEKTITSINTNCNTITQLINDINSLLNEFTTYQQNIIENMSQTATVNEASIKFLTITDDWARINIKRTNESNLSSNFQYMKEFSDRLQDYAKNYYLNQNAMDSTLANFEIEMLDDVLSKISTSQEITLTDNLDEEIQAKITACISFIKGV